MPASRRSSAMSLPAPHAPATAAAFYLSRSACHHWKSWAVLSMKPRAPRDAAATL